MTQVFNFALMSEKTSTAILNTGIIVAKVMLQPQVPRNDLVSNYKSTLSTKYPSVLADGMFYWILFPIPNLLASSQTNFANKMLSVLQLLKTKP